MPRARPSPWGWAAALLCCCLAPGSGGPAVAGVAVDPAALPCLPLASGHCAGPAGPPGDGPLHRRWVPQSTAIADDPAGFQLLLTLHAPGRPAPRPLPPTAPIAFLPPHGHLWAANPAMAHRLALHPSVLWMGPYLPEYKVAPALQAVLGPSGDGPQRVLLTAVAAAAAAAGAEPVHAPGSGAAELLADLRRVLGTTGHHNATLFVRSQRPFLVSLLLDCHAPCLSAALRALTRHPRVVHLEPDTLFRVANKFARGLVQSGVEFEEPLLRAGVDGTGQVVGVSDTGIDHDHCMFFDPNVPLPVSTLDLRHRKIVRYDHLPNDNSPGATRDAPKGHGTHVVGSLVGEAEGTAVQRYHGGAPKAKVAFFDLTSGMAEGAEEHVSMPGALDRSLFPFAYDAGARVSSNSWGGSHAEYNEYARETDEYAAAHPDFLIVFAVGNEADLVCEGQAERPKCDAYTILAPSTAKNVLAVGASQNAVASWYELDQGDYVLRFRSEELYVVRAHFSGAPKGVIRAPLLLTDPPDACQDLRNAARLRGRIAVIDRGSCFFTLKVGRASRSGAVAVIIVNNVDGDAIIMGKGDDTRTEIPAYMVSRLEGARLKQLLQADVDAEAAFPFVRPDPRRHKAAANLADFSSRGPTRDLRLKPEVVAPGIFIQSARSDGNTDSHNCDLEDQMGTSMATPFVSGLALLLRQYLLEGWHPDGRRGAGPSVAPSAALVKAILINSAEPLTGIFDRNAKGDWLPVGTVPSDRQGHGVVRMATVLPVGNGTGPRTTLWFSDEAKGLTAGQSHTHCVYVPFTDGRPFKATLAWREPAGSFAARWQLINDLDLTVIDPAGRFHFGNVPLDHPYPLRDTLNNHEKVRIPTAGPGTYTLVVAGASVPRGPQTYALTATAQSTTAGCAARCPCAGPGGTCAAGSAACRCAAGRYGADCGQAARWLRPGWPLEAAVRVRSWVYFRIETTAATAKVDVHMDRLDARSDPNLYLLKAGLPTYQQKWMSAEECDSCGGPVTNTLSFRPDPPAPAVYFVGVEVSCCFDAAVRVSVTTEQAVAPGTPTVTGLSAEAAGPAPGPLTVFALEDAPTWVYVWGDGFRNCTPACQVSFQSRQGELFDCPVVEVADRWLRCNASFAASGAPFALALRCRAEGVSTPLLQLTLRPPRPAVTGVGLSLANASATLQLRHTEFRGRPVDLYVTGQHLCPAGDDNPTNATVEVSVGPLACATLRCVEGHLLCRLSLLPRGQTLFVSLRDATLNTTWATAVSVRVSGRPQPTGLLPTGPGSAATLEVMGSYHQALAGGLSVWLAGEDLGLAGEAAEVTFGPVGNLTALRCVPQEYVSDRLLHCITVAGAPIDVSLTFVITVDGLTSPVNASGPAILFAGPPQLAGLAWAPAPAPPPARPLPVAWGQCAAAAACTLFLHGRGLGLPTEPRGAQLLDAAGAVVAACRAEGFVSTEVLPCTFPRATQPPQYGQVLSLQVIVSGYSSAPLLESLVFIPKAEVTALSWPLPHSNLSASLGLPALPNGTRLPLWVHGRHLSFSDAAVRVWAQDRRPQRQPWTTECGAVQVASDRLLGCELFVVVSEADRLQADPDLDLQVIVQVGAAAALVSSAAVGLTVGRVLLPETPGLPSANHTALPAACLTEVGPEDDPPVVRTGRHAAICAGHGACAAACECDAGFFGPQCRVALAQRLSLAAPAPAFTGVLRPGHPDLYELEYEAPVMSHLTITAHWDAPVVLQMWMEAAEIGVPAAVYWADNQTADDVNYTVLIPLPASRGALGGDGAAGRTWWLVVASARRQSYRIAFSTRPVPATSPTGLPAAIIIIVPSVAAIVLLATLWAYWALRRRQWQRAPDGEDSEMEEVEPQNPTADVMESQGT